MDQALDPRSYRDRRGRIEIYFDQTAAEAWAQLTSDAPVSRIRETVRRGRDRMRERLLSWLPADLTGARLLDAGCGTGALAAAAAARGAEVVAADVSAKLVGLARARAGALPITFRVGDMLDPALGRFDFAVFMDSLIHYEAADMVAALARIAPRVGGRILFTFAPRTPALTLMHAAGRLFPRANRAPEIVPVGEGRLRRRLGQAPGLEDFRAARSERIASGFYTSQAMELVR